MRSADRHREEPLSKTVLGAYLIAQLKMPTLVIVPKAALIAQWADRLAAFLDALCKHKTRNALIVRDVEGALDAGRTPLVVTKRKEHARTLAKLIAESGRTAHLLVGEGTPAQRRRAIDEVRSLPEDATFAIVATESYLGEGFDMPRLDALFLASPISWDGNITQQSGRLHREHEGKTDVVVYDYVDAAVPMLDRMHKKRLKTYEHLGYRLAGASQPTGEGEAVGSFVAGQDGLAALKADIASARRSIRIHAPYANANAVQALLPALKDAVDRGVAAACTVKPPQNAIGEAVDGDATDPAGRYAPVLRTLEEAGCEAKVDGDAPAGLAVFDGETVWYGSLPLLAFPRADDCSIRFANAEIAAEIADVPERKQEQPDLCQPSLDL